MSDRWRHVSYGFAFGVAMTGLHLLFRLADASGLMGHPVVWAEEGRTAVLAFVFAAVGGTLYSAFRARWPGRDRMARAVRGGVAGGTAAGLVGLGLLVTHGAHDLRVIPIAFAYGASVGSLLAAVNWSQPARIPPRRAA